MHVGYEPLNRLPTDFTDGVDGGYKYIIANDTGLGRHICRQAGICPSR
jgi:hypothetical protein